MSPEERKRLEDERKRKQEEEKRLALEEIERAKETKRRKEEFISRLSTTRPANLDTVPWKDALQAVHVEGGHARQDEGVHIFDLPGGEAICLRSSKGAATELVAAKVASAMDIPVAKCRLVKTDCPEHEDIVWVRKNIQVGDGLKFYHFNSVPIVLEFVPGAGLDTAAAVITSAPTVSFMHELGRLCALDAALNNMDRLPLPLWSNEGNVTNVLVVGGAGEATAIGIDQQVNIIEVGPRRDEYVARVSDMARQALGAAPAGNSDSSLSPASVAARISGVFESMGAAALTQELSQAVLDGLASGFRSLAAAEAGGSLEAALQEAVVAVADALGEKEGESARSNADFVRGSAAAVAGVLASM